MCVLYRYTHTYIYIHKYTIMYTYIYATRKLLYLLFIFTKNVYYSHIYTHRYIHKHPIHNGRGVKKLKCTTERKKSASKQVTSKKANC